MLVQLNKKSTNNLFAKVSELDYERIINAGNWYLNDKGYVYNAKYGTLHKFIMGTPPEKMIIDHINNDRLNNTRENLHFATRPQNGNNKEIDKTNCSSKYRGVCKRNDNKYDVRCANQSLGIFKNEIEAAKKYDTYAYLKFGKDARTNNLVKYDEIKHLDINSLIPKKNKNLPKGIIKSNSIKESYHGQISIYGFVVCTKSKSTIEEVERDIEILRRKELEYHNKQPILRNKLNQAIIKCSNAELYIIVDDDKWHELSLYTWYISDKGYVKGNINNKNQLIHRYVLKKQNHEYNYDDIDHINNNKLDNRVINFREVSVNHNNQNKIKKSGTSKYKGVCKRNETWWRAVISMNGIRYNIGDYKDEKEAALAYDKKCLELYGPGARFNFPENIKNSLQSNDPFKDIPLDSPLYLPQELPPKKELELSDILDPNDPELKNIIPEKKEKLSKYNNVSKTRNNKWKAAISKDKKYYHIGVFNNEEKAAIAANKKMIELYGPEYPFLNKIPL